MYGGGCSTVSRHLVSDWVECVCLLHPAGVYNILPPPPQPLPEYNFITMGGYYVVIFYRTSCPYNPDKDLKTSPNYGQIQNIPGPCVSGLDPPEN